MDLISFDITQAMAIKIGFLTGLAGIVVSVFSISWIQVKRCYRRVQEATRLRNESRAQANHLKRKAEESQKRLAMMEIQNDLGDWWPLYETFKKIDSHAARRALLRQVAARLSRQPGYATLTPEGFYHFVNTVKSGAKTGDKEWRREVAEILEPFIMINALVNPILQRDEEEHSCPRRLRDVCYPAVARVSSAEVANE